MVRQITPTKTVPSVFHAYKSKTSAWLIYINEKNSTVSGGVFHTTASIMIKANNLIFAQLFENEDSNSTGYNY